MLPHLGNGYYLLCTIYSFLCIQCNQVRDVHFSEPRAHYILCKSTSTCMCTCKSVSVYVCKQFVWQQRVPLISSSTGCIDLTKYSLSLMYLHSKCAGKHTQVGVSSPCLCGLSITITVCLLIALDNL